MDVLLTLMENYRGYQENKQMLPSKCARTMCRTFRHSLNAPKPMKLQLSFTNDQQLQASPGSLAFGNPVGQYAALALKAQA
jgi:hypothetical protein